MAGRQRALYGAAVSTRQPEIVHLRSFLGWGTLCAWAERDDVGSRDVDEVTCRACREIMAWFPERTVKRLVAPRRELWRAP